MTPNLTTCPPELREAPLCLVDRKGRPRCSLAR